MKWVFIIIGGIILLPLIIYLLRLLAGIIGFCLAAVGLVMIISGNVLPGIGVIVLGGLIALLSPEIDPEDYFWWWDF